MNEPLGDSATCACLVYLARRAGASVDGTTDETTNSISLCKITKAFASWEVVDAAFACGGLASLRDSP